MLQHTHLVATLGLVVENRKILLLHRSTSPRIWAPPGGRLIADEDPTEGLKREVHEECGIELDVGWPVGYWFGKHESALTLGIIFLCKNPKGEVFLSHEHLAYKWFEEDELADEFKEQPSNFFGSVELYHRAFKISRMADLR